MATHGIAAVTGHQVGPDRSLAVVYDSSAVRLVMAIPGDANLDGVVNIADLGILAGNWQQSDRAWMDADFTGTGTVTIADLGVLAGNWQAGASGSSEMSFEAALAMFDVFDGVVVPEPAGVLLGLVFVGFLGRRRRRKTAQSSLVAGPPVADHVLPHISASAGGGAESRWGVTLQRLRLR